MIDDHSKININIKNKISGGEKARLALEAAETSKKRLDALVELKRSLARLEANNYLKDEIDKN
jgi:hypothetical protein